MNTSVSIFAEIPEELHESLKHYLDSHPTWDHDRVFAAALSLFLLHNESAKTGEQNLFWTPQSCQFYPACARVDRETLFEVNS